MAPSTTALSSPKSNPRDERPYTSQKSFSDVSRATATESVLVESTPPTSSSAVSSQEITQRPGHRSQAPEPETQPFSLELSQQTVFTPTTAHSPKSSPKRSTYQESLLAGHKRTANGETKWPESSEVAQAQPQNNEGATFHSRTSSTLSTGNMVELSQQLRTRLSYAMVKVRNGWTSRTLDEVESLASQHGSPRSVNTHTFSPQTVVAGTSGFSTHHHSPRTNLAATKMQARVHLNREWSAGSSAGSSASSSDSATRHRRQVNGGSGTKPTLAPPADIHPTTAHRCHRDHAPSSVPPTTSLPPVKGQQHLLHPSTPPMRPQHHQRPRILTTQRTPSQNAAMEADAIETLLFMSSPGNSGKYNSNSASAGGGGSAQTSPLRSSFLQKEERREGERGSWYLGKRVGWDEEVRGFANGDESKGAKMDEDVDEDVERVSESGASQGGSGVSSGSRSGSQELVAKEEPANTGAGAGRGEGGEGVKSVL